jgi:hypothetical protein
MSTPANRVMQDSRYKAGYHLERAEYWQSIVDRLERQADEEAQAQQQGRMSRSNGTVIPSGAMVGRRLENNFEYNTAVANRNAHQRQAEIYLLASIAQVRLTPWARTAQGLVRVDVEPA